MTTYTWSASTLAAPWNDASSWGGIGVPRPSRGDIAIIGYGTVEMNAQPQSDIRIVLQPWLHAAGITLAAANIDFGDNTVVVIGAPATPGTSVILQVITDAQLDDGNTSYGVPHRAASIDFSAAPLTIELSGQPGNALVSFTNAGTLSGHDLTVTADAGTTATFYNDAVLTVTGGLTIDAGVTFTGNGLVDLDGSQAYASIAGTVGSGETFEFTRGVQNTLTIANIAAFQGTVDVTHESEIVVQGVSLVAVSNSAVSFSDGSTLEIVPTGSGGQVLAETAAFYNVALQEMQPETLIEATKSGLPCFCTGTRIATQAREMAVEEVRAGAVVRLADGGMAEVAWVGSRALRCDRHARPHDVWPIRVSAGAMAPGVPRRDLWLSPDHAVRVVGHLVPVRHLVNGATIVQVPVPRVRYHHIELARHDMLLAEGLAAESYLDTGNRASFAENGQVLTLHPDFARRVWAEIGCALLVDGGPELAAARRSLLRRAARLGHRLTQAAWLILLTEGRAVRSVSRTGGWHVALPAATRQLRLVSRTWVPAEVQPEAEDRRRLGVAIGRLWLDGREVSLESAALSAGWHAAEQGGRWTDGDAVLDVDGARTLGFTLAMPGRYWRLRSARVRPSAGQAPGTPAK